MATIDQYSAEEAAIKRRQAIAQMLMEQGQQPLETQTAGGYVVPVSPLAGVAKVAQQLAGAYVGKKADERQTELQDKRFSDLQGLDITAPDAPAQLLKRGMVAEAIAAQKDSQKVHREGIPSGFTATDNGGIAPMPMPDGGNYADFLLKQASAKAQIPGYGEPQKLQMAQDANAMAHEKLQMEREEKNRKALEALQPKPITELQQYVLDEKKAKKDADMNDAVSNIDDTIGEFTKLRDIQDKTETGPVIGSAPVLAIRKALPGGDNLQRLEKGYNTMAVKAIGAFKAGGVTFGQLSNKEGEWIKSTQASLNANKEVNKEMLEEGLRLLENRKSRILKQSGFEQQLVNPPTVPKDAHYDGVVKPEAEKTINGKKYVKVGGEWHEVQ